MYSDTLRFYRFLATILPKFLYQALREKIQSLTHRWTFHQIPDESQIKNIVVIGASFAGCHLTRKLAHSLPTGYRVVLIERKSHFNYVFNFPRYSVVRGHEHKAFIPYGGFAKGFPKGIFEMKNGTAVKDVDDGVVRLENGKEIPFEFLAVATGAWQPVPARVNAFEDEKGGAELRNMQDNIRDGETIAILGGGPVGIQLASDIKSEYPDKEVTLFHSRDRLLPNFGERLHEYVVETLGKMGIEVVLNERPELPIDAGRGQTGGSLRLRSGITRTFDLVIPCTGQRPNTTFLQSFAPESLSPTTGRILVHPTLQINNKERAEKPYQNPTFALGDVAETSGPKMARAGMVQADVVAHNIVSLINNRALKDYVPDQMVEGALKLSLGMDDAVISVNDGTKWGIIYPVKAKGRDLDVERVWEMLGSKMPDS